MISRLLAWIDRRIGLPGKSTWSQVYVVENQDWLAPESNISDDEAYDAIVRAYLMSKQVSNEGER